MQKQFEFQVKQLADVNTKYLETEDLDRLQDIMVQGHLATEDDSNGDFFCIPVDMTADPKERDEMFQEVAEAWFGDFGLSERFIDIMRELCRQGISYVRFNADGEDVVGMDPFVPEDEENDA